MPQVDCKPNRNGSIAHVFGTWMVLSFLLQSMTDMHQFTVRTVTVNSEFTCITTT